MDNQNGNGTSRAAAYRKSLTKEVTLPTGNKALLRPIPLQKWWADGRLPQSLTTEAMRAQADPGGPPSRILEMVTAGNDDDRLALLKFMTDTVTYAFVSPRILAGGQGDDELDPSELDPRDFNYVFAYATGGLDSVPVATTQGEVTVGTVRKFRKSRQRKSSADTGGDVPEVPATPVSDTGDSE